ncbi:hypothetical protein [Acetobacter pasteurianus]|uniref:Uncharacterized protein n=1 Tax=Acetobacter pasteurianus (strain NBRC 105184 / IFO 3283-01) TaxID=634452 RepID=C7JCH0_ACEP3|nr:hypothetical protein [Acetobacter pasteurianus]AKR47568.1 hypothetical protein DB34_00255 [Acetobacter pasteurianus]BAH99998.1 hypothetical protein APA01_18730 [Acetobacter pasteurianus IFO 3283-01]BAI03052.1 hypothetical protein APA03_18730 [Acetobacter pasteurianus IFO 3283-03]BAI06097.1 hypothetical protein APA07_18730 [Acetobacter pasteurianus IFO 3283-07]BAI09147.1 hypothetical protein APA22_18730 [Acetobacter pasteurianus IFO 3283-22]
MGEPAFAGSGEEGVDILLGYLMLWRVELALDGVKIACSPFSGDKVDADFSHLRQFRVIL